MQLSKSGAPRPTPSGGMEETRKLVAHALKPLMQSVDLSGIEPLTS